MYGIDRLVDGGGQILVDSLLHGLEGAANGAYLVENAVLRRLYLVEIIVICGLEALKLRAQLAEPVAQLLHLICKRGEACVIKRRRHLGVACLHALYKGDAGGKVCRDKLVVLVKILKQRLHARLHGRKLCVRLLYRRRDGFGRVGISCICAVGGVIYLIKIILCRIERVAGRAHEGDGGSHEAHRRVGKLRAAVDGRDGKAELIGKGVNAAYYLIKTACGADAVCLGNGDELGCRVCDSLKKH